MLTRKNNRRFLPDKLSKDLLKNKFFTSESLVKLVQSYRKKRRKSTFFSYHCVNISLNFLLLQGIQLHKSGIYVNLIRCFYDPVFFARLFKSLKTTSAHEQFGAMPFGTLRQAAHHHQAKPVSDSTEFDRMNRKRKIQRQLLWEQI